MSIVCFYYTSTFELQHSSSSTSFKAVEDANDYTLGDVNDSEKAHQQICKVLSRRQHLLHCVQGIPFLSIASSERHLSCAEFLCWMACFSVAGNLGLNEDKYTPSICKNIYCVFRVKTRSGKLSNRMTDPRVQRSNLTVHSKF